MVVPAIGLSGPRPFKLPDQLPPGHYRLRLSVVDHRDHTKPAVSLPLEAMLEVQL